MEKLETILMILILICISILALLSVFVWHNMVTTIIFIIAIFIWLWALDRNEEK
mgnify:CR=1 FL=1